MSEATAQENLATYDAYAVQKIQIDDGVFAVVQTYSDERFLQYRKDVSDKINEFLQKGDAKNIREAEMKAAVEIDLSLAQELVETLEGYPDLPSDWKDSISIEDYLQLIGTAHNFVIDEEAKKFSLGKTYVPTACYFNGKVARQKHYLRKKTIDDSSKYALIKSKEYERKPSNKLGVDDLFFLHPQDIEKAQLYDEMKESVDGFENEFVPLRVKVLVIDYIFASTINPKKFR